MTPVIKLSKHLADGGGLMYSAAVMDEGVAVHATIVADADRAECLRKCRAKWASFLREDMEPEWIRLEA